MSKLFTLLTFLLLITFTANAAETRSAIFRNGNMKTLSKASKTERKPMMVYVGASFCGQSQKMQEVFSRADVTGYMNENFVCKQLNAGNFINQLKAAGWGVTAVPSYVFMNSRGQVVYVASGYKKPEKLMEEGNIALDKMRDSNNRPDAY